MTTTRQLQNTLQLTYGIVPIVAGVDKFTNLLTNWASYLSHWPIDPSLFMRVVGIVEIIAGILVLIRPFIGAYVVMGWLICIAIQLILGGHYFDLAVRDLVMAVGAFTLVQLTIINSKSNK